MVRIIKKNLGKTLIGVATEMARPTPSEGWHDMARYAVPLYLLAGELKESIGA